MPPQSQHHPPESSAEDAIRRLEARLEQASGAAERLFGDAASEAAVRIRERMRGEGAPAQGWQATGGDGGTSRAESDLELVTALWREARTAVPPAVREHLGEAVRELLLALRALVDAYLERLEPRAAEPAVVEDIPVE